MSLEEESHASEKSETQEEKAADKKAKGDETVEEEKEEQSTTEESEEKGEGEEQEEKQPVPYERFTEVNTKLRDANEELVRIRPIAQQQSDFGRQLIENGITQQDFQMALEVLALSKVDPVKALERLEPFRQGLRSLSGDELPKDLKTMVENNEISVDSAKAWAKDRARSAMGEQERKRLEAGQKASALERHKETCYQAIADFEAEVSKTNPDYKPKANEKAADGQWEKVVKMLSRVAPELLFETPAKTRALVKEIYDMVVSTHVPAPKPVRKSLSSNGSSTNNSRNKAPATLEEAAAQVLQAHGVTMRP